MKAQVLTGWGTIETNTITIALVAPIGADNAVWEAIKTDSRLTRFIQDPRPDERDAELVAGKLRGLLNASPNSIYSSDINRTLTNYAQRKDSMERMLNESGQPRCK